MEGDQVNGRMILGTTRKIYSHFILLVFIFRCRSILVCTISVYFVKSCRYRKSWKYNKSWKSCKYCKSCIHCKSCKYIKSCRYCKSCKTCKYCKSCKQFKSFRPCKAINRVYGVMQIIHVLQSNILCKLYKSFTFCPVLSMILAYCQTPTKSLVNRLGVDFVFTLSQSQSQESQQPHQKAALEGNLGS